MLLSIAWRENARDWPSLHGHAHEVDEFFESLPVSKTALHYYIRFLYLIGEESLPAAFVRVAEKVQSGDARALLAEREVVFLLETILQRHVYARPAELKRQDELQAAILYLLERLVDAGSSAAFRMRDDFLTPLSPL